MVEQRRSRLGCLGKERGFNWTKAQTYFRTMSFGEQSKAFLKQRLK
jgi:hypothetical protein